jgi:glycerol-3-phosphate cytidylyltransferase
MENVNMGPSTQLDNPPPTGKLLSENILWGKGVLMKRVITYGTFDLLHYGHINLLSRAKRLGDYLIVGLSSEEFNQIKNKKSYFSYEERKMLLEAIRYVDLVIPENNWEQKIPDIEKYNVDIFVMGDDWTGKFDFLKEYCEVIYLSRTEEISSTKIKQELKEG